MYFANGSRVPSVSLALVLCAAGFAGCGETDSTSSSLTTQVAETAAAQVNQCEMLAAGEDCLTAFLVCLGDADPRSAEGEACREQVKDCLPVRPPGRGGHGRGDGPRAGGEAGHAAADGGLAQEAGALTSPTEQPAQDPGTPVATTSDEGGTRASGEGSGPRGSLDGGDCDGGPRGAGREGHARGPGGGHPGLPAPEALSFCRDDLVACLASGSDETACTDPLRVCLRAAFTAAFTEMCEERVAACEGSTDPRCTELTNRCSSGGPSAC